MSTYGKVITTTQLQGLLEHVFKTNDNLQSQGLRSTPILIWGKHGLGKTQSVMDFAKSKNWKISYCAPCLLYTSPSPRD